MCARVRAKPLQSCPTLRLYGLPGSSVHGFLQARILEGIAMPSPENLPDPGIEPTSLMSPALAGRFFTTRAPGKSTFKYSFGLSHSLYLVLPSEYIHDPKLTISTGTTRTQAAIIACLIVCRSNQAFCFCLWPLGYSMQSLLK